MHCFIDETPHVSKNPNLPCSYIKKYKIVLIDCKKCRFNHSNFDLNIIKQTIYCACKQKILYGGLGWGWDRGQEMAELEESCNNERI